MGSLITNKWHWLWKETLICSSFYASSSWWSRYIHVTCRPCGAHRIKATNRPIRESWPWTSWLRSLMLLISQTSTASSLYVIDMTTQKHVQTQKYTYTVCWVWYYIETVFCMCMCVFLTIYILCILVYVEDPPGAPALPGGQGELYWLRPHPYPGQWAEGKQERDPDQQLQVHLQPSRLFLHQGGAREGFPLPPGINLQLSSHSRQ